MKNTRLVQPHMMDEKLPREIRSIEDLPGKLTIVLYQTTLRAILAFAIFAYACAIILSLYIADGGRAPLWSATVGASGVFILFSIIVLCVISLHYKYITISCDSSRNTLTVTGSRPLNGNKGYFIGTKRLSEIHRFETKSEWVAWSEGGSMEHRLLLRCHEGDLLKVYEDGERTIQFLADKFNTWLRNLR